MQQERFVLSMLVANEAGVLTRVASMFARRGFNIDSLTVGETENREISRMTIVAAGDDYVKDQIVKQVEKLHDVKTVVLMDLSRTVTRELLLVKVGAAQGSRAEVMEAVTVFRGKVVDLAPESLSVELTGPSEKLDAFIDYVRPYGILELGRTGITALGRGTYTLTQNLKEENQNGKALL